ncbi:hypothetical protein BJX61DRAFT_547029 [Aspergillus egyptiacus]|nr:hypothetical protein BJX61DRAFT_547029 [Aspergillus egyptiacus]
MENNNTDLVVAGDGHVGPDIDGSGYDANEERLLLQIMESSNGPASPDLQAVLDDHADIGWSSGQRQLSPLRMERPRSSGIDTATFSFAKPAQRANPFSLQPISKPTPMGVSKESVRSNTRVTDRSDPEQNDQLKTNSRTRTENAGFSTAPSTGGLSSGLTEQTQPPADKTSLQTIPRNESRPHNSRTAASETRQASHPEPYFDANQQQSPHQGDSQGVDARSEQNDQLPDRADADNIEATLAAEPRFETLIRDGNYLSEIRSPERSSSRNHTKIVKRRPSDKRRTARKVSHTASDDRNSQVPEEVLFQQLIRRLRAREESEAVALRLQNEMEANMSSLEKENTALKGELETLSSKLRQRTTEARSYKSQTDSWRSKLTKIKNFLNELGTDYQNLRGEAIHIKATRKSLDKERKEIAENIEAVKARLLQISQASLEKRERFSESESLVASLRQEINHARERALYFQCQLADEKKRSRSLELYIQSCSRSQDKKLDCVKDGQLEMTRALESAAKATRKTWESSLRDMSEALRGKLEGLNTLLRSTSESLKGDRMDVKQCRETISTFESRMEKMTRQFAENIESNSKFTERVMERLEEQVQTLGDSASGESALLKQLSASDDKCGSLQTTLEKVVPALDTFSVKFEGLREVEGGLGQRMESLETSIAGVKLPERFGEDYFHISEKLGLENEIQQLSLKLRLSEEKLEAQHHDGTQKHNELLEMTARVHQAEVDAAKFESRTAALQDKIRMIESKSYEELSRATTRAREEGKAEFERQLYQVQKDKTEAELHAETLKEQLIETRRMLTEAENSAKNQRSDLEMLLTERQMRIEDLEASRVEQSSKLAKQEAEIESIREQLRQREAALLVQQISMQSQLDEANERSAGLEGEVLKATTEAQQSAQALQALKHEFASIQADLARNGQENEALSKKLEDAIKERLSLESGKSSSLEDLKTLQDNLSLVQVDIVKKNEENKALRKELEDVNDARSSLESNRSKLMQELQSLRDSFDAREADIAKKGEEIEALRKEVVNANSARASLESGKSKAKSEVHELLKRVQASDTCMKRVKDILVRMNIAQSERPFLECLDQLEATLQSANGNQPLTLDQDPERGEAPDTGGRDDSSGTEPATTNIVNTGKRETSFDEPKTPVKYTVEPSPSKQKRSIVPFSSIAEGLSPAQCHGTEDEPFDLLCLIAQTPEKASSLDEFNAPANPEKGNPFADIAVHTHGHEADSTCGHDCLQSTQNVAPKGTQEQIRPGVATECDPLQSKGPVTGRKVSFDTRRLTSETDLQVPDSQEKDDHTTTVKTSLGGDNPTRINRWTYSKRQRETLPKQPNTSTADSVLSQNEEQHAQVKAAVNKRPKLSSEFSALATQARTASELYDRRKSPTRLASGSSRTTSSNMPSSSQTATKRANRRSTRRTRGDKYNARFSQGA